MVKLWIICCKPLDKDVDEVIINFESDGSSFESPFEIVEKSKGAKNWITVFIAENGGKKSFLLRCLTEAGLGHSRVPMGNKSMRIERSDPAPRRVIAISGTPLDRFPRAGTRDLRSRKRSSTYSSDRFVYLGQRAMNGMSGVSQSERSLVGSLFTKRSLLKKREELLKKIFLSLGLEPVIYVYLRPVSQTDTNKRSMLTSFQKFLDDSTNNEKISVGLTDHSEASYKRYYNKLLEEAANLSPNVPGLVIDTDRVRFRQRLKVTTANFDLLIKIGAIEIDKTRFRRCEEFGGGMLTGEELSSGQWNWLSSFGGLVMELDNDSLILIDEPENSLHPNWQREYMPALYDCISDFTNCQIVVATHSPLIASGVSPNWGEIRTLKRLSSETSKSSSIALESAYGWSATDVYDEIFGMASTRAPGFLASANAALEGIANGIIDTKEAANLSAEISTAITQLPEFDPLKQIYSDIVKKLKKTATSVKRRPRT